MSFNIVIFFLADDKAVSTATIESLHEPEMCHLYFLVDKLDSLGVSSNFQGGFDWAPTALVHGSASDSQIIRWLRQALAAPIGSTSRSTRVSHFFKIWDGAFNTETIVNFYAYYMPDYDDRSFEANALSKKERILHLLSWGVPFVPLPAWTEFILRQTVVRNCGDGNLPPLRLDDCRHSFYVKHGFLTDSRSPLEVAFKSSGVDHEDFKSSVLDLYNSASSQTAAYAAVFSPATTTSIPAATSKRTTASKPAAASVPSSKRSRSPSPSDSSSSSSSDSSSSDSSESDSDSSSSSDEENKLLAILRKDSKNSKKKKSKKAKKNKRKSKSKKHKKAHAAKKEGHHHYHTVVRDLDMAIKRRGFIDFYAYTPARLDLLKQLGASSKASSLIPGSNLWISTSAPVIPDPALILRSKANLSSGFYFYLSRLDLSTKRKHLVANRVRWWSWLSTKFHDNDHALLSFTSNFVLKYHGTDDWALTAENAHQLYIDALRCSDASSSVAGSSFHKSTRPDKKKPHVVTKKGPGGGRWTPEQTKAVNALRAKCPANTCLSRIIKDHPCFAIKKGTTCSFLHACGWCKSTTCAAACSKTPPSPL